MSIATEIARLQQAKADLKTAINAKGRAITDEPLDEYAAEVDLIEVGGGTVSGFEVRYIDYDGTIIDTQYVTSGNSATPPTPPTHTGLTFEEWNNPSTNITYDRDIGATYYPTDGKTHAFIKLTTQTGLAVTLNINKSDTRSITVDWGDSLQNTSASSGDVTFTHTYSAVGEYEITLFYAGTAGTYKVGKNSSSNIFIAIPKDSLTSVVLSKNVIGLNMGFYKSSSLETIVVPNSVTTFGYYSDFIYTLRLKCFVYPMSLSTASGSSQFQFSGIRRLVLPYGMLNISGNLAYTCKRLDSIVFPTTVTNITGTGCFSQCYGLKKLVLSKLITSIAANALNSCYSLEELVLPNTLTSISTNICSNNHSMRRIIFPGSIGQINTSFCDNNANLDEVIIPEGIHTIYDSAFRGCTGLKSVVFPSTLTTITASVFEMCRNILEYDFTSRSSITILNSTSAFTEINQACIIKVPLALEAAWKAATNWSTYADYIVGV